MPEPKVAVYHGARNVSGKKTAAFLRKRRIPFKMVCEDDILAGCLHRYGCVIFPGGHSVAVDKAARRNVLEFVNAGGGFMGICAGCNFGAGLGLLPLGRKTLRASGMFDMRVVRKHPVTHGYQVTARTRKGRPFHYSPEGRVRIRYNNGGLLLAEKGATPLVCFDEEDLYASIVAGRYGKGRVVLISSHPESTPAAKPDTDLARVQDPAGLVVNAIEWITFGKNHGGQGARAPHNRMKMEWHLHKHLPGG